MSAETKAKVAISTTELIRGSAELAARLQSVLLDYAREHGGLRSHTALAALRIARNYGLRNGHYDMGDVLAVEHVVDQVTGVTG